MQVSLMGNGFGNWTPFLELKLLFGNAYTMLSASENVLLKGALVKVIPAPLCHNEPETILYRLRDCATSRLTWERLGVSPNSNFYEGNLVDWLKINYTNNFCRLGVQPPWRIIFPFTIWLLWKYRNATIFRNLHAQPYVHKEDLFRALEFQHYGLNAKKTGNKRLVQVRWERPQAGWPCLNTNGAAIGNPGQAGSGGLIRNEHGEWLGGFSRSIGYSNSFMAEL